MSVRYVLVFVAYFFASEVSLWIQTITGMGTQIWPASGIALTSVLLWGPRVSISIFLATLAIHAFRGDSLFVFLGPAVGNTIEALVGAYICNRPPVFDYSLHKLRDITRLIVGGALFGPFAGALFAVPYIWLTQLHYVDLFYFMQYWAGDSLGVLMVAPLILVFSSAAVPTHNQFHIQLRPKTWVALAVSLLCITLFFTTFRGTAALYFFFPFILWIAIRLGQRGVTVTTLVLATVAISETAMGLGPFASPARSVVNEFSLLLFVATLQTTGMVVAGIFRERENLLADEHKAKQEAENAVRVRNEFLDLAAHELHTPMTSLSLSLQLLRRNPNKHSPEKLRHLLEITWSQAERLKFLSNELLNVSRLERGQMFLHLEELDLRSIVREVVSRFEFNLLEAHCSLTIHDDEVIKGNWDRSRIDEVITNLLSNAIKFGHHHPIEIILSQSNNFATLMVRDHGIGIEPSQQSRLFQRFERGVSGRQYSGLGLGLYICRNIITAHGGSIRVDSRVGEGSVFTVVLPCQLDSQRAAPVFQNSSVHINQNHESRS